MVDNTQSGMPCSEFDGLLMEAVEGKLKPEQMHRFRSHADSCGVCGPLFADAQSGFSWLQSLAEVEPPATLVHNILAATSEQDAAMRTHKPVADLGFADRLRAGMRSLITPLMQPRLAGTFAMAFFSLSLLMNVAGIKLSDARKLDLRPASIKNSYYSASSRVVKYYENLRIVYELQSKVREIKEAMPAKEEERKEKDGAKPERKQNQKRDDNISNRPNNSERDNVQKNDAQRYQRENAAITLVVYDSALYQHSLKRATFTRAVRNDRRTA